MKVLVLVIHAKSNNFVSIAVKVYEYSRSGFVHCHLEENCMQVTFSRVGKFVQVGLPIYLQLNAII